jgi:hemoglobin
MTKRLLLAAYALFVLQTAQAQDKVGGFYEHGGKDPGLFEALGGQEKIAAFTKDFVGIIAADPQIGHFFQRVNKDRLARKLTEQFVELAGGPGHYSGGDMDGVHESLGITNADFNKLAEDLQTAMDRNDIGFATQNRLIALLAPMQRAIVTK